MFNRIRFHHIWALIALTLAFAAPAFAGSTVNINTADASTIAETLKGVGLSKAKAIVAYRDEHGPFKSVDQLSEVKGIGPATLERNREVIALSDSAETAPAKPSKPKKQNPTTDTED